MLLGYPSSCVLQAKQSFDPHLFYQDSLLIPDLRALEFTELRIISEENKGSAPGPEASLLKIRGSEIQQRISELTLNAVGYYGLANNNFEDINERSNIKSIGPDYAMNAGSNYLNIRKTTIYGGSNEIQKNILSKMVLGL